MLWGTLGSHAARFAQMEPMANLAQRTVYVQTMLSVGTLMAPAYVGLVSQVPCVNNPAMKEHLELTAH